MNTFDLSNIHRATPAYEALTVNRAKGAAAALSGDKDKAWQAAQEFEAVYLNTMFSQMMTGMDGDGPFGGSQAVGVWRSFLTDEYARSFSKSGGIGIAADVYRTLLEQQEARIAPEQMEDAR